jgi:hypothetical protein
VGKIWVSRGTCTNAKESEWRLRPLFTSQPHCTHWPLGSWLVIRPLSDSQPHFTLRRLGGSFVLLTPYLTSLAKDQATGQSSDLVSASMGYHKSQQTATPLPNAVTSRKLRPLVK